MTGNHVKKSEKRRKQMLFWYTGYLFLWAVSIVLMPVGNSLKESTMLLIYISGVMFWLGMLGTVYMAFKINRCRKGSTNFKAQYPKMKRLGLIHFFQNKPAIIADIVMFVSIIGFGVTGIYINDIFVLFIFLAVFVFSFGMHCMLNGINFEYIKSRIRRDEKQ